MSINLNYFTNLFMEHHMVAAGKFCPTFEVACCFTSAFMILMFLMMTLSFIRHCLPFFFVSFF